MAGHAKKCVERYCVLANRTTQQLYKVSTPCIDDHHLKKEEMKSVGELSGLGPQAEGLRCRQRRFFYSSRTDIADGIVPRKSASQKKS